MQAGRNDPCPCGSGKKYKNCCRGKDLEAQARSQPAAPVAPAAPRLPTPAAVPWPAPPPAARQEEPADPRQKALEARWKEFRKADYEGKLALFARTLDEGLMDEENALDMLEQLYLGGIEHADRERFDGLVREVRQRAPEAYAAHVVCILSWQITNALATGRPEALPALADEMAEHAASNVDLFHATLEELAYHGQLLVLLPVMRKAWPIIREAKDIFAWALDEYAQVAGDYEIFAALEANPETSGAEEDLQERMRFFIEDLRPDKLVEFVDILAGRRPTSGVLADYQWQPVRRRRGRGGREDEEEEVPDEAREHLSNLTLEFLGWLRRERQVPYTKGALGREGIAEYLLARGMGELQEGKARLARPEHPLCPDRATLDRFLVRFFGFLSLHRPKSVATLELTPTWLLFLELHGLLSGEQRRRAVEGMRPLAGVLQKALSEGHQADPALGQALTSWGQEPAAAPHGGPPSA
jgi:hypothetical protein